MKKKTETKEEERGIQNKGACNWEGIAVMVMVAEGVCLEDGALGGGIIVAPFLLVAQLPHPRTGLIERLQSAEGDVHLILIVPHNLCQVVHVSVIVHRCQVVCALYITTASKHRHRVEHAAGINIRSSADHSKTTCK